MKFTSTFLYLLLASFSGIGQNTNPSQIEIHTNDIVNFFDAFDKASPNFEPEYFEDLYIKKGSSGLKNFMSGRIKNAKNMAKIVSYYPEYYASIRKSTEQIPAMEEDIKKSFSKLKDMYPASIFPPVYFVIGTLNSGGTSSDDGLIIGAEMYGLTDPSIIRNMNAWLQTVLKPVDQIPHIVAHELIHYQQHYKGKNTLLKASIKEGSADFIGELISGKHINQNVHDYANPKEKELWNEFSEIMNDKNLKGWLYSSSEDRPNDLGYWMGYKITKAYYDNMEDKKKAIFDILNISNFNAFLEQSKYEDKYGK